MNMLLALLVMTVFGVQFIASPNSVMGEMVRDVFVSLILLNGLVTAMDRPGRLVLIGLVVLIAIVVRWAAWLFPDNLALAIREETTLLALVFLSVTIGMKVFGSGKVTLDRISGAVALYLLVGLVCAVVFQLISLSVPEAFSGIPHDEVRTDRSIWIYFSFVTLTTVGYGDIVPIARAARALANLEALIGQLYPAIVLARLVSLRD
jgi:hypothetical protein